jgi:hypothetical protein
MAATLKHHKLHTNILRHNMATYETFWQQCSGGRCYLLAGSEHAKKEMKNEKITSTTARQMHTLLNPICSFLNMCSTTL